MAEIVFTNVSKRFGDTVALDDVSFEVPDNSFFCFFGPPLCGKSTVLRLILGLDRPDEGEILIGGEPVSHRGPAERNIAMVFQNLALFPHMTARQNVAFPLVERGVAKATIDAKVEDVAAKLHMSHILHKVPGKLSGGERQRVAIARALVRDPVAYLMDDPISALDARLREETRVELKRIQREVGHTLVYVTHDQEEAMSIADRMAIMREGRIEQVAAPMEIYDGPANAYVASILGAPPINLRRIAREGGTLRTADGAVALAPEAVPDEAASVGIRPEHARIVADPHGPLAVDGVEPLGGFTVVTLTGADNEDFRVLLRGQPRVDGDARVRIECDADALLFFDAGDRLIARDGARAAA